MIAEIIAVGTELLMGQTTNTNARDLASDLSKLGIGVYYQSVVGDNETRLTEVFSQALNRSDLIIICGGLGPTDDDITRPTVAKVLDLPLEKNEEWEQKLQEFFKRFSKSMQEINLRQAMVPEGGELLPNDKGTAPGIYLDKEDKVIVLLPGPPHEMLSMLQQQVLPRLQEKLEQKGISGVLSSRVLRVIGLGESDLVERIKPILRNQTNPTIAPLAKHYEVHLRITAWAENQKKAEELLEGKAQEIKEVLGDYIYGEDEETLETAVAKLLCEKGKTVSVAESCSGGLLSHRLTNVPGSSRYFLFGAVTYSNEGKEKILGVRHQSIENMGAVSEEVAREMAAGSRKLFQSDIGIGITGIAGPGGETPEKPVGLTYIGIDAQDVSQVRRYQYWGERQLIKERVSQTALHLLRLYLLGKLEP